MIKIFYKDRQEKFPEEFRIDSSDWDYQSILDTLNEEVETEESVPIDVLKEIILRVWRVNNRTNYYKDNNNIKRVEKMVKANDEFDDDEITYITKALKNSLKPIKYINKQSKAALNIFNENGFVVKDHTNTKYYDGMALDVLAFETSEEIEESTITETRKPSIFYNDELILNGEVIVTAPKNDDN